MIPCLVLEISPLDAFCDGRAAGVGIGDFKSWIVDHDHVENIDYADSNKLASLEATLVRNSAD